MVFPSTGQFIKSIVIAAVLGLIAYFAYSIEVAAAAALGALIGAAAGGVRFEGSAREASEGDAAPMPIFVGNLAFRASREELTELFEQYGPVTSARIVKNRQTGRPRGFGFVEMPPKAAKRAMKALDGQEFLGRTLRVREGNQRSGGDS